VPAPEKSSVSITVRIRDGIAEITLDRPPLNGLDVEMLRRLDAAIATYRATVGPSRDATEGISAFLEKRAPAWSHR
jgi:enoyl-CoA hydratase/carnithine racemase